MADAQLSRFPRPWGTMAVHEWPGEDPAYLFLHGNGCAAADWTMLRPFLPERALALDFAGHGASVNPSTTVTISDLAVDVVAYIEDRGLSNLTLVGHSLGGMVGIEVAFRSRAVAALVLVEGWTSRAAWPAFGPGHMYGALPENVVTGITAETTALRERMTPAHFDPYWQSVCDYDGFAMLAAMTIPVVEIYGSTGWRGTSPSDLFIPSNPNIALHWIENAGHFLLHERPAAVAHHCRETRRIVGS